MDTHTQADIQYIIRQQADNAIMLKRLQDNISKLMEIMHQKQYPSVDHLNRQQAADMLHVSPYSVDKYLRSGKLIKTAKGISMESVINLNHARR